MGPPLGVAANQGMVGTLIVMRSVARRRPKSASCRLLACCLCLAVSEPTVATEQDFGSRGELTSVTVDRILQRSQSNARNLRWFNSEQLQATFTNTKNGESETRVIELDGTLGKRLGEGDLFSASPDGRMQLQKVSDRWVLFDVDSDESITIEEPEDENRLFSSWIPPVWSNEGRYAAIVEAHLPRRPVGPLPTTIDGVSVIDVGRQVSLTKTWASRITIVDRRRPKELHRMIVKGAVHHARWGADGSLFAVRVKMFGDEAKTTVLKIRPEQVEPTELYSLSGGHQAMVPAVDPSGKIIALVGFLGEGDDKRSWTDFAGIVLVCSETGRELKRLNPRLPIMGMDYLWSRNGDEIYIGVRHGANFQVYAIPLEGHPRQLTHGQRRHWKIDLSPDGRRLSYQTVDGYGRKDIRTLDIEGGQEEVVLIVDDPAEEFLLGHWQQVRWDSSDGVRPFGHVIKPAKFDPNHQYPMIVEVRGGGPGSGLVMGGALTAGVSYGPLEWHAWAALGYVVFVPDYRSAGEYGPGRGRERYKEGDLPTIQDIEDIVSGTRSMVDRGFVDPARIAILGHSAGGGRVHVLLTKHELYAAAIVNEAIPPDPVSRFISGNSGVHTGSIGTTVFRNAYGGALAEFPYRYKANYMFDHYRNKTPTLIMVGNEELGGMRHMPNEIMYTILRQHGVPTRLLKFVEEGHNYSRPESAKLAFEEVRRWLETHMPSSEKRRN